MRKPHFDVRGSARSWLLSNGGEVGVKALGPRLDEKADGCVCWEEEGTKAVHADEPYCLGSQF